MPIGAELKEILDRRRGVVERQGDKWETSPEESGADVKATVDWIVQEAEGQGSNNAKRINFLPRAKRNSNEAGSEGSKPTSPSSQSAQNVGKMPKDIIKDDHVESVNVLGSKPESLSSASNQPKPDLSEAYLQALLNRLREMGRTDESRELMLSQHPEVQRALSEMVKMQATANRESKRKKEVSEFAVDCASRWLQLLQCQADAEKDMGSKSELSEADLRTIDADVSRTRRGDEYFTDPELQTRLHELLKAFCETEAVRYTQGLHEVAAVFVYIDSQDKRSDADKPSILACFTAFIRRFVPFYHDDEAFVTLHICLLFFRQLLLYHHPDVHNKLGEAGVSPFIYATPWFITFFSAMTPMPVLLQLWDRYVIRGEESFLIFVSLAMMVLRKKAIMSALEDDTIYSVRQSGIRDEKHLDEVWAEAEALKARTPKSFDKRLNRVLAAIKIRREQPSSKGREWSEHVVSRVEKERRFLTLPNELLATWILEARAQQESIDGKPDVGRPERLRFLLLDLRTPEEAAKDPLSKALHFCPPCLRRLIDGAKTEKSRMVSLAASLSTAVAQSAHALMGSSAGGNAIGMDDETLGKTPSTLKSSWEDESVVTEVFEELHAVATKKWGENWFAESAYSHVVLVGGEVDVADLADGTTHGKGAVGPMYEVLTEYLSFPRVSVVQGGAAALLKLIRHHRGEPKEVAEPTGGGLFSSAWSQLQAASESIPAAEVASGRIGGLLKGGANVARSFAGTAAQGIKEGAAVVRQQAAGGAEVVRQQAAGGMSAISNLMESLDADANGGGPSGISAEGEGFANMPKPAKPKERNPKSADCEKAPGSAAQNSPDHMATKKSSE